jgi:hypothetical protein
MTLKIIELWHIAERESRTKTQFHFGIGALVGGEAKQQTITSSSHSVQTQYLTSSLQLDQNDSITFQGVSLGVWERIRRFIGRILP